MSFHLDIKNAILWALFGTVVVWVCSFLLNYLTPFEFNVNHTQRFYGDMCAGETSQAFFSARTVRNLGGVSAHTDDELFKFSGGTVIELDTRRSVDFTYQKNGGELFQLQITWPIPLEEGLYGVGSRVEINPYFGVYKDKYLARS